MNRNSELNRGLLIGGTWLLWLLGGYCYLAARGSIHTELANLPQEQPVLYYGWIAVSVTLVYYAAAFLVKALASDNSAPLRADDASAPVTTFVPNEIPKGERQFYLLFSLVLLAYGTYGVWANDLYVPGKRSGGMHLHDEPAWIMYGAIITGCLGMLSVIVDHYDKRNNERHYKLVVETLGWAAWIFFVLALIFGMVQDFQTRF